MKKFLFFTITLVLLCVVPVQAADVNTVKAAIVKHALELGVDPAIALSIARTESGFSHNARSSHGAVGVFQLMPSTAKRMGLNPYLLNDNIKGGIMYYKSMYKMFGSVELALAAYNAGPGNVKRYNAIPPYAETRRFVSKIMKDYNYYKANPDPAIIKAKAAAANKQQTSTPKTSSTTAQKNTTIAQKAAPASAPVQKNAAATAAESLLAPIPAMHINEPNSTETAIETIKTKDINAVKVEVLSEPPFELEIHAASLAI